MRLNTRTTIVLLLLAFSAGAFGCADATEESDHLATIPQEIVLFSAELEPNGTALSFGYSKTAGWQLLRYAELQNATAFDDNALQSRQQGLTFSGSAAPKNSFNASLANTSPLNAPNYSTSFSGAMPLARDFSAQIAGGPAGVCAIEIVCDFFELICESLAHAFGGSDLGECRSAVSECRTAISHGMAQLTTSERVQLCSIFDGSLEDIFDFDPDDD